VAEPSPVNPKIVVNPTSGLPGSIVTIEGAGFKPRSETIITMDGIEVASIGIAPDGTFSATARALELSPGVKPITAHPGQATTEFN
jgi:hypothetical protein